MDDEKQAQTKGPATAPFNAPWLQQPHLDLIEAVRAELDRQDLIEEPDANTDHGRYCDLQGGLDLVEFAMAICHGMTERQCRREKSVLHRLLDQAAQEGLKLPDPSLASVP